MSLSSRFVPTLLIVVVGVAAAQDGGRVSADSLAVRTGPGARYEAWKTLKKDDSVQALERRGAWVKIRVEGWVDDRHLELQPDGSAGKVTAQALNVRAAPAGQVMQWLARGDQVKVLGKRSHWTRIESHGWVEAAGLALPPAAPPRQQTPEVAAGPGDGLPLDLVPVVTPVEDLDVRPTEITPLGTSPVQEPVAQVPGVEPITPAEVAPVEITPAEITPVEITPAEITREEPQAPAPLADGPTALRLLGAVPALARAFAPELAAPQGEEQAQRLLPELLGAPRPQLHAAHGARFRSPAELDQALDELRLRAREDPALAAALAARSGLEAAPEADPLAGTWTLESKGGPVRLTLCRCQGEDFSVRREELGPDGAVKASKTGFARLKKDELTVTYASSRGALEELQQLYQDVGTVLVPGAEYELDLRAGRIRGRHWARGKASGDVGVREEGWRAERIEPVAGVYDLEPGYLIGKDPIELEVRPRADGRWDLVRTTRKGPGHVDVLEGTATLKGRELQASFGGSYEVRQDGRIEGRVNGNSWGESGWKRSVVRPLSGRYELRPTWYAFGKKPPIALTIEELPTGDVLVVRQAEGQPEQVGQARVKGRELEVRFEDGARGSYEVREDGRIQGSHTASSRAESRSEGGWRQDLRVDPAWFDRAVAPVSQPQAGGR